MDIDDYIEVIDDDYVGDDVSPEDLQLAMQLMERGVISGDELEIVGDDDIGAELEIVGAAAAGPKGRRIAMTPVQLRKVVAKNVAKALRRRKPMAIERHSPSSETETNYLPIYRDANHEGLVPAQQEALVKAEPQKPFRPEALVLDDDSARDFLILDIRIGNDPLFVGEGAIPASMFTADAVLNKLSLRTGRTSQQFSIRVRNRTQDPKPFYASFKGTTTMR